MTRKTIQALRNLLGSSREQLAADKRHIERAHGEDFQAQIEFRRRAELRFASLATQLSEVLAFVDAADEEVQERTALDEKFTKLQTAYATLSAESGKLEYYKQLAEERKESLDYQRAKADRLLSENDGLRKRLMFAQFRQQQAAVAN